MSKKSFLLYYDQILVADKLTIEQRGHLLTAIIKYVTCNKIIQLDPLVDIAFFPIKNQLDRDNEKYSKIVELKSKAGKKSASTRVNRRQHVLTQPTVPVTVTDNVNDNDTDNVIVTDTEAGIPKIPKYTTGKTGIPKIPETQNKPLNLFKQENDRFIDEFKPLMSLYPARAGGNSEVAAYRVWLRLIESKEANREELKDSVIRYQKYCVATGKIGTEYVLKAKNFFEDQYYKEKWEAPHETTKQSRVSKIGRRLIDEAIEAVERERNEDIVC